MPHSPQELLSRPPHSVINRQAILERFGADKLALVLEMAATGDVLADAAIETSRSPATVKTDLLEAGIRCGLASLEAPPPALHQLLRDSESTPPWIDASRIEHGAQAYLSVGPLWLSAALGPGSLAHTYSSPTIAAVLMQTANLDARAMRRLAETAAWNHQVARPAALRAGAPGYVHNLQVRMLHARVRAGLLRKDWANETLGMPISQLDMARTWLDFTYVPFTALEKVGITFTAEEFQDMYHLWQLIAHQLGVDPRLYRLAHDQPSGAELLALIDGCVGEPDDNSRALTVKMLEALGTSLHPALQMPQDVAIDFAHTLCRHFHGDTMADKLGAIKNWTAGLIPTFTNANRYQRLQERADSQLRRQKIEQTMAAFDQIDAQLQGPTTYQVNITELAADHLPQTA